MCPQTVSPNRCKVALVAFVRFFSRVSFQMGPQMACLIWCIVTLVAFVWFFSRVSFQMCPQMACLNRCIVTLVAFIRFFSRVNFQMCFQIASPCRCIVTLIAFVCFLSIILGFTTAKRFWRRSVHSGDKSITDQFPNPESFSVGLLLSLVSFTITSMQWTTYLGKKGSSNNSPGLRIYLGTSNFTPLAW